MNTIVLLKMVPDVVEELEVAPSGKGLETEGLRMILSEPSDHALEQALLLKEKYGGKVTVVTLDAPEVDDAVFTALAKGADRAIKIAVDQTATATVGTARTFSAFLSGAGALANDSLVLIGSQAIDDLEGELGPYLAGLLNLPFLGVVTGVTLEDGGQKAVVTREFSGGLRGQFELPLPAVLGVQAAEKPPRYVPVAKVRAAMKSAKIETVESSLPAVPAVVEVDKMYRPETSGRAEMLDGSPEEVAHRIVGIMAEKGLV